MDMLKVLRRIVQELTSSHDFSEALSLMVKRIREAMETDACSVFLIDDTSNQYVLAATDGLNPNAVGVTRLSLNEGLIGLVGHREEPINLDDAPSHPNFLFHPEAGEERYKAFLGVPIIHHRHLLGVLIVQQQQQRRYDESEEAFLVTMSAQIAGVIAHAEATGSIASLWQTSEEPTQSQTTILYGIPSVHGTAMGRAFFVYPLADLDAVPDRVVTDISTEIAQFEAAIAMASSEITALSQRMQTMLSAEEAALFDVYSKILESPSLKSEVIQQINAGNWAQGALRKVVKRHVQQFEAMEDDYLRERGVDFRDLGERILTHLQANQKGPPHYPDKTILVGEEVTASALAEVPRDKLVGVVSAKGSSNSHVAILAKAMGVPTVMGVDGMALAKMEGRDLIVDGYYGQIYISPTKELYDEFSVLAEEERKLDVTLQSVRDLPCQTPDGHPVTLLVNTGLAVDAGLSLTSGAEGVGLYRTEVPFMMRDRFPAEEEQRVVYRQLLQAFAPRPVIMRTLDVGGDKSLPYFPVEEDNPFLGWRGIRITLDHPEVFLMQVRAMMRASVGYDNLHIMLPMVTSVSEVDEAVRLLSQAYQEVVDEGANIRVPPLGVMIEVPSAVYQARALAQRVDFLSVGSNDLTQYILAVDRNNSRVANLYDALHPAVLQALLQVVQGAHHEGKKVSICGEMAGDPVAAILLIGMGFDALSMNSTSLLRIKYVIRNFPLKRARELVNQVISLDDPALIRLRIEHALDEAGLGGLMRGGK
jgi:phosphotransferase system, enzyme I, PtsP